MSNSYTWRESEGPLTPDDFASVCREVRERLVLGSRCRRAVKYVVCSMDNRDGEIWRVEFRPWSGDKVVFQEGSALNPKRSVRNQLISWIDDAAQPL